MCLELREQKIGSGAGGLTYKLTCGVAASLHLGEVKLPNRPKQLGKHVLKRLMLLRALGSSVLVKVVVLLQHLKVRLDQVQEIAEQHQAQNSVLQKDLLQALFEVVCDMVDKLIVLREHLRAVRLRGYRLLHASKVD